MATNRVYEAGRYLTLAIASKSSGDVGVKGQIVGVCVNDTDADGNVVVDTQGVYSLAVKGADGSGNAAVAAGDIVYWDSTEVNVDDANGIRMGYALEAVTSGATSTIMVKLGY